MSETAPAAVVEDVLGSRIVAALIDVVIMAILGIAMSALFGDIGRHHNGSREGVSINLSGVPFLIYLLLVFLYYAVLEAWRGQTLGKMVMKLRVVAIEGELTPGKVAVRTLLRVVDGLPFLYLVGFILLLVTKPRQRIGDLAARTLVMRA
jgi:uncharacterized RDD family membrane protein YckC